MAYNSQDSDFRAILSAFLAALSLGLVALLFFVVGPQLMGSSRQSELPAEVAVDDGEESTSIDETIQAIGEQKQEEERRRAEAEAEAAAKKEAERKAAEEAAAKEAEEALAELSNADFVLPESASRYYTRAELEGLSSYELMIARNEIFARHGRSFNSADLSSYFATKRWYHPQYSAEEFDAMPSPLNDCERANIALIMEVEAG